MINEYTEELYGLKVEVFETETTSLSETVAYRLHIDWDQEDEGMTFTHLFTKFRQAANVDKVKALVIGRWKGSCEGEGCQEVLEGLVAAQTELRGLKALFIADMIVEDCEMSWIRLDDMSPLWSAYPELEMFRVRGMENLSLGTLKSDRLKTLIIETGGLPANVLKEVCEADLPQLEHLELWLGDDGYGWESSVDDLQPILSGTLFPNLKVLGLRNSCEADAVAKVVADAPILDRIKELDLSLGNLGDEGAEALLASSRIPNLTRLDLHHHFMTDPMLENMRNLGIDVDLSGQEQPDEYDGESFRYIAVSE